MSWGFWSVKWLEFDDFGSFAAESNRLGNIGLGMVDCKFPALAIHSFLVPRQAQ
jgi:hypothetical protein